jgi:glycosyltransferase involved in cell wall biosynthesis
MGTQARRLVEERYSWRIVANQFQRILEEVVENRENRKSLAPAQPALK